MQRIFVNCIFLLHFSTRCKRWWSHRKLRRWCDHATRPVPCVGTIDRPTRNHRRSVPFDSPNWYVKHRQSIRRLHDCLMLPLSTCHRTGNYGPTSPFLQRGRFSVIPEEPQNSPGASALTPPIITTTVAPRQGSPDWDFDDDKSVSIK